MCRQQPPDPRPNVCNRQPVWPDLLPTSLPLTGRRLPAALRTCGGDPARAHFLDMPFYQTGQVPFHGERKFLVLCSCHPACSLPSWLLDWRRLGLTGPPAATAHRRASSWALPSALTGSPRSCVNSSPRDCMCIWWARPAGEQRAGQQRARQQGLPKQPAQTPSSQPNCQLSRLPLSPAGKVVKDPLGPADIRLIVDLLERLRWLPGWLPPVHASGGCLEWLPQMAASKEASCGRSAARQAVGPPRTGVLQRSDAGASPA